jgi:hypothetical protein
MAGTSGLNIQVINLSVGFSITGGTSARTWTFDGTGNATLAAQQTITLNLPNRASDTIVGFGDYTAKGVILVGTGTGTFTPLAVGTNGFVLTADSTQTSGLKYAAVSSTAAGVTSWVDATGSTQAMTSNVGYYSDNATAVAFTLPTTAAQFEFMVVRGIQGSWSIAQNSGQSIVFGTATTTTGVGGSLSSTTATDSVTLQCVTANTKWIVAESNGNITFV